MSAKGIYKYKQYFGRSGTLSGIFIAKADDVQKSMGEVYLGEVLGKHSEVWADLNSLTLKLVTDNPEFVKIFEEYDMGTGCNPVAIFLENGR